MAVMQTPQMAPQFMDQAEADYQRGTTYAYIDRDAATRRAKRQYDRTMDQFRGSTAARGSFYSTAREEGEQNLGTDFMEQGIDINQALHRQLDDFTRRRTYASMGLII